MMSTAAYDVAYRGLQVLVLAVAVATLYPGSLALYIGGGLATCGDFQSCEWISETALGASRVLALGAPLVLAGISIAAAGRARRRQPRTLKPLALLAGAATAQVMAWLPFLALTSTSVW